MGLSASTIIVVETEFIKDRKGAYAAFVGKNGPPAATYVLDESSFTIEICPDIIEFEFPSIPKLRTTGVAVAVTGCETMGVNHIIRFP
jgi:hypothetical protein